MRKHTKSVHFTLKTAPTVLCTLILVTALSGCTSGGNQTDVDQEVSQNGASGTQNDWQAEEEARRRAEEEASNNQLQEIENSFSRIPITDIQVGEITEGGGSQWVSFIPFGLNDSYIPIDALGLVAQYDAYGDYVTEYGGPDVSVWRKQAGDEDVFFTIKGIKVVEVRIFFLSMVDKEDNVWGNRDALELVDSGVVDLETLLEMLPSFTVSVRQ